MTIAIEFPDEIAQQLAGRWGDLAMRAREAVAVEGYRTGALSHAQLQSLLGLGSRLETDALLKRSGVYLEYSEEDLSRDLENSRRARAR